MKYKVCYVTSTRADYSPSVRLIKKLYDNCDIDFKLVVTGTHLLDDYGYTYNEIINDGLVKNVDLIKIDLGDGSKKGMALAISNIISVFVDYFSNYIPDILLLFGDRFEIFGVATAASILGIKIAHISGGDITEGAIDDVFRNSITQMSVLHFPGCEDSRKRIIDMGKNKKNVINVGEPGVENCLNIKFLSKKELSKIIKFDLSQKYAIVTYHPETVGNHVISSELYEIIHAMDSISMNYIITASNTDAGGNIINNIWEKEKSSHNNWLFVKSLGEFNYLNCLNYATMIVGNSSSGIVEAPVLGISTVNIGNRQKGRMMAKSVINSNCKKEDIKNAMLKAMKTKNNKSYIYGDGKTSNKIIKELLCFLDGIK